MLNISFILYSNAAVLFLAGLVSLEKHAGKTPKEISENRIDDAANASRNIDEDMTDRLAEAKGSLATLERACDYSC